MGATSSWYEQQRAEWAERFPEAAQALNAIDDEEQNRLLEAMFKEYLRRNPETKNEHADNDGKTERPEVH